MDIGKVLLYPTRNSGWVGTMLLIFVLFLGVITAPFALGYLVRVARCVANGEENVPAFDNWGDLYLDGLRWLLANLIYFSPVIICAVLANVGSEAAREQLENHAGMGTLGLWAILQMVTAVVERVWLFVYVFFGPLFFLCVTLDRSWGACFNFSLMKQIVRNRWLDYIIIVLLGYALTSLGSLGALVFLVGALITVPYMYVCWANLLGVYLRKGSLEMSPYATAVLYTGTTPTTTVSDSTQSTMVSR